MSIWYFWRRPDIVHSYSEAPIGSSAAVSGFSLAAQGGLRLLFLVGAARLLGPQEYGEFGTALAISSIAIILGPSSAGAAFSKFVGGRSRDLDSSRLQALGRRVTIRMLQSTLCAALFAGVTAAVLVDFRLAFPTAVLTVGLAGQAFGRGVHMAFRLVSRDAALQVGAGLLSLLSLYVTSRSGVTGESVCLILASGLLLYLGLSYPRGVTFTSRGGTALSDIDKYIAIAAVGSIASAGLIQLCVVAGNMRLPLHETGQLSAAASLATPIGLAASAIGLVALPKMAALAQQGEGARLALVRLRLTCALTAFSSIAVFVAAVAGNTIARFVLGSSFTDGGTVLAPLVMGVACISISSASATSMSSTVNRSLALVSGSAWAGLAVSTVVWFVLPGSISWIAGGYAIGSWTAATLIILAADRHIGGRAWPGWLWSSGGLWLMTMAADLELGTRLILGAGVVLAIGGLGLTVMELRRGRQVSNT